MPYHQSRFQLGAPSMDDLTSAQHDALRHKLLALQEELSTLIEASADSAKPVSLDQPIGRLSRMDAIQLQHMAQANRHGHEIRLRQVQAALAAMDEGVYGDCKKCEEPIGYARLNVRPEAPFCIACQEQSESR
ncbi:TraR/DksA family transcriptional regulator [Candidatus Entotheonella palauensis]|uniref:TraR/DksA family transcriptional regulator n=1 Tax=Candidatus Entotheonella palauensis TaxID=93172 RepID=UPI0015C47E7B|nr:TraR/DksA family transcriptional regulator [Candidatus Entotheonella palauensis]